MNCKLDKRDLTVCGVPSAFSHPSELDVRMACPEKPSVAGCLFSLAWFLFEVHPSVLSGSSDTGCGAGCQAADVCGKSLRACARMCGCSSIGVCQPHAAAFSLHVSVGRAQSQLMTGCQSVSKQSPSCFPPRHYFRGILIIPYSVNIDSFFLL